MEGGNSDSSEDQKVLDTNYNDNPLISGPIALVTMAIEPHLPGMGQTVSLKALLDSGCTRCLVRPALVEKFGIRLRRLKIPIALGQVDGSVAGGIPATFTTVSLEMTMGSQSETLSFTVTPGMNRLLILGLNWLKKWNPRVDWRKGLLKFPVWGKTPCSTERKPQKDPWQEISAAMRGEPI